MITTTIANDWFTISHTPENSPRPAEALLEDEDDLECCAGKKNNQHQS